ncbi:phosphoglycolate phosphatase [Photobacterium sanctipauli]|uniref:Phosphoglycolate phosphatase n=1 Tax=Photobacterium sanctipauli TaxID=1342794 RepID=A0A2T3NQ27_9GAMM|nr:HAD-IA family hydrolase [Photobacterium sanctipauli]PSW18386.1 phosphoglycolate phosphatase [Photobacterium sanctipauli]
MATAVKAVLFDLDGTLLDTAPDMANAANKVLADYNQPPLQEAQIQAHTSYGAKGLLTAGFGEIPTHLDPLDLRQQFLDYYQQKICVSTSLYQGIPQLLRYLEQQGIPWGIMTNKPGFLTDMLLPFFPELMRAQTVICGDTLSVAKPHPEPLLHASEMLGIHHEDCIYIGDIEKDMIAANAACMTGFVAGWGYIGKQHTPDDWQAEAILSHPEELIQHLETQTLQG